MILVQLSEFRRHILQTCGAAHQEDSATLLAQFPNKCRNFGCDQRSGQFEMSPYQYRGW